MGRPPRVPLSPCGLLLPSSSSRSPPPAPGCALPAQRCNITGNVVDSHGAGLLIDANCANPVYVEDSIFSFNIGGRAEGVCLCVWYKGAGPAGPCDTGRGAGCCLEERR